MEEGWVVMVVRMRVEWKMAVMGVGSAVVLQGVGG